MDLYLQEITTQNGVHAQLQTIGFSFENRPIRLIKINDDAKDKPIILMEAGVHSREWITSATVLKLIDRVLNIMLSTKGKFYKTGNIRKLRPSQRLHF